MYGVSHEEVLSVDYIMILCRLGLGRNITMIVEDVGKKITSAGSFIRVRSVM